MTIVVIILVAIIIGFLLLQSGDEDTKGCGAVLIHFVIGLIPTIIGLWILVQIVTACI